MELLTTDILDEDEFWNNYLKKVKEKYLFSCATGVLDAIHKMNWERQGIEELHAYTIMEAKEINLKVKLKDSLEDAVKDEVKDKAEDKAEDGAEDKIEDKTGPVKQVKLLKIR